MLERGTGSWLLLLVVVVVVVVIVLVGRKGECAGPFRKHLPIRWDRPYNSTSKQLFRSHFISILSIGWKKRGLTFQLLSSQRTWADSRTSKSGGGLI
jgi:hypothetical protein